MDLIVKDERTFTTTFWLKFTLKQCQLFRQNYQNLIQPYTPKVWSLQTLWSKCHNNIDFYFLLQIVINTIHFNMIQIYPTRKKLLLRIEIMCELTSKRDIPLLTKYLLFSQKTFRNELFFIFSTFNFIYHFFIRFNITGTHLYISYAYTKYFLVNFICTP